MPDVTLGFDRGLIGHLLQPALRGGLLSFSKYYFVSREIFPNLRA